MRAISIIHLFLLICLLFTGRNYFAAQTPDIFLSDSSIVPVPPADTSAGDTVRKKSDLEGPVKYTAEQITFSIDGKKSFLRGNVRIEYQNMQLEAGQVFIDWEQNYMKATGIVDTTDSLGNPVYREEPIFRERGQEPIYGTTLEYYFKNQRGKVLSGRTSMPPGYYQGETIKKIGDKTLLVRDGYFTSCDSINDPHFYYKSYQMRILTGKRATAKPIIMYIEDVPVLAVPFGIFPMERGRRSGIIIPKFGNSSYGGRSLRDFGYYWAASDYWDATFLANFFEKTGTAFEGELRYVKRYSFNGSVHARYAPKDVTTGQKARRWSLDFNHNHTINETTNLSARGSFVSDQSFLQDYSHNQQDRLNQVLTTDVNFSKRWPNSKNSFSASASRTENLQLGEIDFTLPRLNFSHTQSNLINFDPKISQERKWYHDITYNYNSSFISKGSRKLQTPDSTYLSDLNTGWQHSAALYFNSKIFKYFKYNQNIQFNELWVPRYQQYTFVDSLNNTTSDTVYGFKARHTFSLNVGTSTTMYGLFEIPFSPLRLIRHKMDPVINFTFSPDFTDPQFGYVKTFQDTLGRTIKRDQFTGNPFGGTSSAESRRMTIALNNLFQGKLIKNGEEKKIDLLNLNFNTGYNFIADSLKWSDLRTSMRTSISREMDFNLTATHTFYQASAAGIGKVNRYTWDDGFTLPRLLNIQMSARFHLAPPAPKEERAGKGADTTQVADSLRQTDITVDPITEGLRDFKLPWDLTANFTYNIDKSNLNNVRRSLDVNLAARLEITRNWRIQYNASIDLKEKQMNYQSFNIYRDLHCWEMSFSWGPNPQGYSFFSFEIHVKEPALRDIKLTKSSGGTRVY